MEEWIGGVTIEGMGEGLRKEGVGQTVAQMQNKQTN